MKNLILELIIKLMVSVIFHISPCFYNEQSSESLAGDEEFEDLESLYAVSGDKGSHVFSPLCVNSVEFWVEFKSVISSLTFSYITACGSFKNAKLIDATNAIPLMIVKN